jgi:hypothetical protein
LGRSQVEASATLARAVSGVKEVLRATKARTAQLVPRAGLRQTVAAGPLEGMVMLLPPGWEELYTGGEYEPGVAAAPLPRPRSTDDVPCQLVAR